MADDRIRSIVPMFGGATQYVETVDAILEYVEDVHPSTDDLVGWHRGTFERVSKADSILRRVRYLQNVGLLTEDNDHWRLGDAGEEYVTDDDCETLARIMLERNVGLRSLLYALTAGPMTIDEIDEQQLDSHPVLGWTRGQLDMPKQRANWLRSLGYVERDGDSYRLTDDGRLFTETILNEWSASPTPQNDANSITARTYEMTTQARYVDPEFRQTVLSRYDSECPVSGVDHEGLLDIAHVLSWSDYPDYRTDLTNVVALSKTHHAAFDRELFTLDGDYRLHVAPAFRTESPVLQQTILDQAGERLPIEDGHLDSRYLNQYNESLAWYPQ
ncbi:HNH endonuclease [Halomarina rubra]|uniref:HNH endonuclease n=1 Tax=Halomarina rubra TaxID=2071873 RepID=A0ABD6AVS5_9EURY|nr:HNH endonuclease [Halomarina rubra]